MQKVMLDDRLGNRFQHKQMIILGDTLNMDKARPIHARQIQSLVEAIQPA